MTAKVSGDHAGLVAKYHEAQARLEAAGLDNYNWRQFKSATAHTAQPLFDVEHKRAQLAELEARFAVDSQGKSFNYASPDVENLRALLSTEIESAREIFVFCDSELPDVPALASFDPEAVLAHAEALIARDQIKCDRAAQRQAAFTRLSNIFGAIHDALKILNAARKADSLPSAGRLLPHEGQLNGGGYSLPGNAAECDIAITYLDSQRRPPVGEVPSQLWHQCDNLRKEIEAHEALEADMLADAAYIEANPNAAGAAEEMSQTLSAYRKSKEAQNSQIHGTIRTLGAL